MKRIVEWFINNTIAANLLMVVIFAGGISSFSKIDKQFFPDQKLNKISVSVIYPGAGPREVETQIVMRIEEAVDSLDGIDEINSVSREGSGIVTIDVEDGYDSQRLLNNVKSRIDAINTFPVEAERPQVTELAWKSRMVSVALAGNLSEKSLKELGESLRDQLSALPDVALVELRQPRDYEVSIEISESELRRYGLRFDDVVNAINTSSLNLPAGKIRSEGGDIQLQTRSQAYVDADFENIVLISRIDGAQVFLGDVATVTDGFAEIDVASRFNDKPALNLDVYVTTRPDVLKTSEQVNNFVEKIRPQLPPTVEIHVWRDMSVSFKGRMGMLFSNGLSGLLLVFVVLMLFLRPLLAFWVCMGIGVSFIGAFWLLPYTGISLNMISLFGFILILGILVDDAIIVAESIHSHQQGGEPGRLGAITGTAAVIAPVWFAVISTMIFFAPMYFLAGDNAAPKQLPVVVILALSFSLLEAMLILPSHLAQMGPEKGYSNPLVARFENMRQRLSNAMTDFASNTYRPFLEKCMEWRGLTLASFMMALIISLGLLAGGWLESSFFPKVPADYVVANVSLAEGGPFSDVEAVLDKVEGAAKQIKQEYNDETKTRIGNIEAVGYNNSVRVTLGILDIESSDISAYDVKVLWEQYVGELPMAEDFDISFTTIPVGKPIEFLLSAPDGKTLRQVSEELKTELGLYPGVFNVRDSLESPRTEIELRLKPQAETLNLSLADLASQVRRGFYGEEVQRIPRLREDVKVMVRYPLSERRSEDFLREMRIRTPDGKEVPFETVAAIDYVPSYTEIERRDRRRIATVTADLQPGFSSAKAIMLSVFERKEIQWESTYPGFKLVTDGEELQRLEFVESLKDLFLFAMIVIFGLIAVAFKSYWQPLLVLSAVPFGFMGAILGHLVMGLEISMFSLMGILATAGVVVNDNLVLIDRVNHLRDKGVSLKNALLEGAQNRFRPIILTSITTFIGLLPIMAETSIQAMFLKPMVTSLAFGVALATIVTLIFTPILYLVLEGIKNSLQAKLVFFQQPKSGVK